jgi:hypothetical protein
MPKSRHRGAQMVAALQQMDAGRPAPLCLTKVKCSSMIKKSGRDLVIDASNSRTFKRRATTVLPDAATHRRGDRA